MNHIELALKTWYPKDHPLHLNPRHPAIKLAGEAGELLDLYGKHEYKPGFDWWQCVNCKEIAALHGPDRECLAITPNKKYVSLIEDELGDFWYYLRILAYQADMELRQSGNKYQRDLPLLLSSLNLNAAYIVYDFLYTDYYLNRPRLANCYDFLLAILSNLDISLDQLTESNYQKLNNSNFHGWKNA